MSEGSRASGANSKQEEFIGRGSCSALACVLSNLGVQNVLLVTGNGDVIEPDEGIVAIGSGGNYALAAAKSMLKHTKLPAADVARQALEIAADICVYTNHEILVEEL